MLDKWEWTGGEGSLGGVFVTSCDVEMEKEGNRKKE